MLILALLWSSCTTAPRSLVNLAHLDRLCEEVTIAGQPCTIVHIYSDAPDYGWTDAAGEGIACVDDVARAAVVYMRAGDARHLARIRGLLRFVLLLQNNDGTFYNFVHRDLTINREGPTSVASFGFWAARGYWSLGEGYAFFRERDPAFAAELRSAFRRCLPQLEALAPAYGSFETVGGRAWPSWLLNHHAADATSEFLLGAAAVLAVEPDPALQRHAARLAEGLCAMQAGREPHPATASGAVFPPEVRPSSQRPEEAGMAGAFYSWPGIWHGWGNAQLQALAPLSALLADPELLRRAEYSGRVFLGRMLAGGWLHEFDFNSGKTAVYSQIAYDVRAAALGLLALHRATGQPDYARLAGIAASWLTGNNLAGAPLYDAATGRGYDGIDREGVNRNAGAESTIEALFTLIEIEKVPTAAAWLQARSSEKWDEAAWPDRPELRRTFRTAQEARLLTAGRGGFTLQRLNP
ncbi:MAG TPA: hypothetical protein PKI62_04805 [bacterium]|nr:hypothetical protein [bacterium]